MHLKKPALLAALACCLALPACESLPVYKPGYYRIVETNVRGEWLVAWEAEGRVRHTHSKFQEDDGSAFSAVSRKVYTSKPPYEIRYPLGRRVMVSAPHILVEPIDKPAWLKKLDEGAGDTQQARKAARMRNGLQ